MIDEEQIFEEHLSSFCSHAMFRGLVSNIGFHDCPILSAKTSD